MTIKEIKTAEGISKLLYILFKLFAYPGLFMLWFYLSVHLPFKTEMITYWQSFILLLGINLIKKL